MTEAAERLRVSASTVDRLRAQGDTGWLASEDDLSRDYQEFELGANERSCE